MVTFTGDISRRTKARALQSGAAAAVAGGNRETNRRVHRHRTIEPSAYPKWRSAITNDMAAAGGPAH